MSPKKIKQNGDLSEKTKKTKKKMVWVKLPTGTGLYYPSETDLTLSKLKEKLLDTVGVPQEYQNVYFNESLLKNEDTSLLSLGITEDSSLNLMYGLNGGAEGASLICCWKVRGGGCGCCPVEECVPCWKSFEQEFPKKKEEEDGCRICCSIS